MPQKSGFAAPEKVQQSPQYAALEGLTTGAAEASPLQRFCAPVEQKLQSSSPSDDVEGELYKGWIAVMSRAAATSYTEGGRSALAAFLVSLTQKRADGQQANSDYGVVHGMKVWQDLPLFGWQVRDAWNFGMSHNTMCLINVMYAVHRYQSTDQSNFHATTAPADDKSPALSEEWTNVNAFIATLVSELHDKAHSNPDLSVFGLWTIRDALEEDNVSDSALAAASVWFIYAAPTLLSWSKEQKSYEGNVARGGFAHKDAGWTGYSPARWGVWQQRLSSLQEEVKEEGTRELVKRAIETIGKAR